MRMTADHPRIAITAGDPCGVGPEVILKALSELSGLPARLVIIGDLRVFEETARRLKRRLPWTTPQRRLTFLDRAHERRFQPGRSSRHAGAASLAYLELAMALWRTQRIHGLVTAPVTKWAMAEQEPGFAGQTEYLAKAMRRRDVVMMFISDHLRLALLTRHLPLGDVPRALTAPLLRRALRLTLETLRTQFQISRPRVAVCGLNPHAGEAGRCGREEQVLMQPVLRALRRQGAVCDGPFAADGLFAGPIRYDAVVCAYHDQGLIPFKMAARDRGCQLSVGLPIVRTSPDHGSALDIAGRGIANPGSMIYAIRLAAKLARRAVHGS